MTTRYSPSTGNFYPLDISYPILPEDLIEVSDEDYVAAMGRATGWTFGFVDGKVVLAPPAPVSFAAVAAPRMAAFRQNREIALNRLSGIGFAALQDGDTAHAYEVASVRLALLNVPSLPAVRNAESLAALDAALEAAWTGAYVGGESDEIVTAMAVGAGGGQTRPPT